MRKWGFFLVFWLAFHITAPIMAQSTCPPDVLLALARASSACYGIERNQVCIGSGDVSLQSTDGALIEQTGQIMPLNGTWIITLANGDVPAVAQLQVQASITDNEGTAMTWLALGDVSLMNLVPSVPTMTVTLTGTGKLRATPAIDGDIIMELAVNRALVANGRTDDGRWLRVSVPNSNDLAWISSEILTVPSPINDLNVIEVDDAYLRPFQVAHLSGQSTSLCEGQLPSGLLIQSPHPEHAVSFTLNNVPFQVAATVFITADGELLTAYVLEGSLIAGPEDARVYVPAGARIQFSQEHLAHAEPFGTFEFTGLPLNALPRRFTMSEAITQEDIAAATTRWQQATAASQAPPLTSTPDTTCRYVVRMDSQLYAGPAEFYEVVNPIAAGQQVMPVQQTTDANDTLWYQLRQSSWIRASRVETLGECRAIPVLNDDPAPTYNTVSLETCEPTNGPLRAGQQITFEFTPPPFDNYGEARRAVSIDPGSVVLNDQTYLWVRASDPIRLGTQDERYLRIFRANWTAEPGTYRVRGERLSYIAICYLTVPVG